MASGGPLPPVPGALKTTIQWVVGSDSLVFNILHFHYTGTRPQAADLNTLATTIATATNTNFGPLLPSTSQITSITVQDLTDANGAVGTASANHAGTATGQTVPAGSSVVVSWLIGRHYRGGHPRTYFPLGTATALATPQTWNLGASMTTAVTAWRNAIIGSTFGGATIDWQISIPYVSKAQNPTPPHRVANPVPDHITGFRVNSYVGSQRRRQLATH